jgi:hypothetical protein
MTILVVSAAVLACAFYVRVLLQFLREVCAGESANKRTLGGRSKLLTSPASALGLCGRC